MPLNDQQRAAVRHRAGSVVLAAGAGCGKTTVLTERYLSHLRDDGATVPAVVAITFTERAAREMRGRIRAAVEAEVRAAPGSLWEQHRRDLDAAPIDTIHGYCGRLIRRFPGPLPAGFRVFDDPQAASIRTEAVRDELYRLLTDPGPVGDDLRELAVLFGWAATVAAVEELLDSPDRDGWQTWAAADPDWASHHAALLPDWLRYQAAAGGKLAVALRTLDGLAVPPGPGADRVRAVLDAFADPSPAALAGVGEVAKVVGLKKGWADPAIHEAVKDAFAAVREGVKELAGFDADPADWPKAAEVGRRFLRVAAAADDAYRLAKRRAGGADFHDLLVCARDLLRDDANVRAAVQAETRFLLVDEFQDTDPLQMEIVRLAVGDGYRTGRLFAVGDRKQSIYRFRGADVGLFEGLERDLGSLPLTVNYRSRAEVIGFVNALFRRRLPGYQPLVAGREAAAGGAVEFLWAVPAVPDSKESAESVRAREADAVARRVVELVDGGVRAGDIAVLFRAMSHVAAYESALRRHGLDFYVVGGRAFFAQQEVYDLANLLAAVENPLDGPALLGALRSPAGGLPDDVLHLLATHPDGLWAGLHDDTRLSLLGADRPAAERCRDRFDRWRRLKDRVPVAALVEVVFADTGFDAATQFEPLADRKLANLWKLLDLARGFDRDGLGLAAFAARLAESVAHQPREGEAATVPERADDVVRLMSVHKAKGLEFPVVIVPDLGAAGGTDRHPVARWHRTLGCLVRPPSDLDPDDGDELPFPDGPHRLGRAADELADWQEGLRVLYVACTRARDRLILSAGLTAEPAAPAPGVLPVPPPKAASGWLLALSERYDLLTGRCVDADGPPAAVWVVRPGGAVSPARAAERLPPPEPLAVKSVPFVLPPVVSLAALQALAAGADLRTIAADPEPTPVEQLVRLVLGRWDFADRDGWRPLLAEALADAPADADRDELRELFERFAGRPRERLAGMGVVRRGAELLFEPAAVAGDTLLSLPPGPVPALSGRLDLLTKDDTGQHLWLLHATERPGRNPWADAKPWLGLLAAAAKRALGEPVRTVGLLDAVAGEVHTADARRLSPAAGLAVVGVQLKRWVAGR